MVNKIWFRFDLIRFQKNFLCGSFSVSEQNLNRKKPPKHLITSRCNHFYFINWHFCPRYILSMCVLWNFVVFWFFFVFWTFLCFELFWVSNFCVWTFLCFEIFMFWFILEIRQLTMIAMTVYDVSVFEQILPSSAQL